MRQQNEVELGEAAEFIKFNEQHQKKVKQASIEGTAMDKNELQLFADAYENTMCAVAYLRYQAKENSTDLEIVTGKCILGPKCRLSVQRLELQAAVKAVQLKEQIVREHELKTHCCSFWCDSKITAVDTKLPS